MSMTKPINVVCAALFAGIILTFSFYFGISAMIGDFGQSDVETVADEMTFSTFSRAYYCDDALDEMIDNIKYILFDHIDSDDIILGDNNFLFDAGTEDNGYNYLRDYIGNLKLSQSELEAIESIISLRKTVYEARGVDYLLVVIPNSQTVYSNYMPSYMGDLSSNTRLAQLTAYLEECGCDYFLNATGSLMAAKNYGKLLYNNTENSLNSLGEWYLYDAVCQKLEQIYGIEGSRVGVASLDLYTRRMEGKALARRAGLSSVILNDTLSLSNSSQTKYAVSSYYGTMVRTAMTEPYISEDGVAVLLEFTNEWDRALLMPYFSNTYAEVAYKDNHQFSRLAVEHLNPSVIVQFIHEYEINDMLDSNTLLTYSSGLQQNISEDITAQPLLIGQCSIDAQTVCVAGETEHSALMKVSVDGEVVSADNAIGELFFVSIDMGDRASVKVKITAQAQGKKVSEPIELTLYRDEHSKPKTVSVGSNSELYSNDYSWLSFLSDEQILAVRQGLEQKVSKVKQLTGKDTEYIYIIVPDKLTMYPDDATEQLKQVLPTLNKYRDTVRSVREGAGMTVIDLAQEMNNHKALARLYGQTDVMWTGFGAYVGYHSLISKVSEKFESVQVHELMDFSAITEQNVGGELVTRLGLDGAVISENYLTLQRSFQPQARFEHSGDSAFDITQAFISYTDDSTLPVAIVMRDEFGTEMLENIAEHFSKMIVLREGDFAVGDELISEIRPDYIINIRCNGELS